MYHTKTSFAVRNNFDLRKSAFSELSNIIHEPAGYPFSVLCFGTLLIRSSIVLKQINTNIVKLQLAIKKVIKALPKKTCNIFDIFNFIIKNFQNITSILKLWVKL